jgi:hypothetical protein
MSVRDKSHPGCKACPFKNVPYPRCVQNHGQRSRYQCPAMQDPLTAEYGGYLKGDHDPMDLFTWSPS